MWMFTLETAGCNPEPTVICVNNSNHPSLRMSKCRHSLPQCIACWYHCTSSHGEHQTPGNTSSWNIHLAKRYLWCAGKPLLLVCQFSFFTQTTHRRVKVTVGKVNIVVNEKDSFQLIRSIVQHREHVYTLPTHHQYHSAKRIFHL